MENKKVKIKLEYDFKTMKHYNYYNLMFKRKSFLVYLIPLVITFGVGIYMAIGKNYPFAIMMGLLGLYLLYQIIFFEKVIDNQITKFFLRNPRVVVKEIEINENEIVVYNPKSETPQFSYPWEQISEIHDTLEYIFLLAYRNAPVIINKNEEFFLEGDLDQLQEIIIEKAKTKPYKVVTKPIAKRPITFVHQPQDELPDLQTDEVNEDVALEGELLENNESNSMEIDNPEAVQVENESTEE